MDIDIHEGDRSKSEHRKKAYPTNKYQSIVEFTMNAISIWKSHSVLLVNTKN